MTIWIPGTPRPGGSKSAFPTKSGKIAMVDASGKHGREWRKVVAAEARRQWGPIASHAAMAVTYEFIMPRPKSHFRSDLITLKPSAPQRHIKRPDATKLVRSAEDACTKVIWVDDAQAVQQLVIKRYARPGESSGLRLTVEEL